MSTADEVAYAGGTYSANTNYYLYTGSLFWTMSPSYFQRPDAFPSAQVLYIGSSGQFIANLVWNYLGVRPVINLIPTIEITDITQTGTIEKPYVIKIN